MAAEEEKGPNPRSARAVTLLLVIVWYLSSMLAITTSKLTMQMLRVPLVLCSVQFMSATAIAAAVLQLQGSSCALAVDGLDLLGGLSLAYTLAFFLTNYAFSVANASFVETVKAGEPISTVVLAFLLLGERERAETYAALVPVVLGVGMASSGEAGGSLAALAATLGSNCGFSGRAVLAKLLKREWPGSPAATSDVCLFFHISWMGLVGLMPLAAAWEGGPLRAALASPDFHAGGFLGMMLLNGLMYTAYNQLSFMVLSRVATATHAVLNVCRRVCVIGVTALFFGTPVSMANAIGVVVAVLGMLWFGHAKSVVRESKSAVAAAADKEKET